MDHCASVLLAFPDGNEPTGNEPADNEKYHRAVRQHVQKVEKLMKENASSFASLAPQLLEHVNPAINSISYLALLQTILTHDKIPQTNQTLLVCTTKFLMTFDARQMRYVGSAFSNLLSVVGEGELFPASVAVDLLATAILRVDPAGSMLTSHHLALVNLAYLTCNVEPALPVIEKNILFYPNMKGSSDPRLPCDTQLLSPAYISHENGLTNKLTSTNVLRYDLVCALCFIERRSWQQAFDALERVISYPTKDAGCSKMMAEAHNKWLLVGLLLYGRAPTLPALTWGGPQKAYGTLGKPYASIAKAFEKPTADAIKAEFETLGHNFWAEEGNVGLMETVISHYQRWKILDLRDVYTKISLEQIRTMTQSAETGASLESEAQIRALLEDMIATGMLHGTVVEAAGDKPAHLVFSSPEEEGLSEVEFSAEMVRTASRIRDLGPVVKATSERLATSQPYLKYLVRERRAKEKEGLPSLRDLGSSIAPVFETQVEDEDLMMGTAGH